MKYTYAVLIAAVVIALRVGVFRRRRSRRALPAAPRGTADEAAAPGSAALSPARPGRRASTLYGADHLGDVGLIARREITERLRGRIFRVGTLAVLIAVGAAIIIPTIHGSSAPTKQTVGVVGSLSLQAKQIVYTVGRANHAAVKLVAEPSLLAAEAGLRSGKLDFAIVDDDRVLVNQPVSANSSPADPSLVQDVAEYLGVLKAYEVAGLTPAQAALVYQAKAFPVQTLEASSTSTARVTSVVGLVLMFIMLTQYNTWILMGVMQEKSSRVVEVLLATVRPLQLLGGKVLGIGLVALGQAAVIVGFAFVVASAVGSSLLHGTAPLLLVCELGWLVLGYAFYCWVYAAAGSTAERQDQVQTLVLPLSVPILVAYVFSITVASSGSPDILFKILAYLPPTAPFCMSVLVGLGRVTWWEFVASVLITAVATVGMAIFAARIYRRAVLRTGSRVHIRELFARTGA